MKLALIQQACTQDRQVNLQKGLESAKKAAQNGAEVICFAELAFDTFFPQFPDPEDPMERAEPIPGPTTQAFASFASEYQVVVILNLYERDGDKTFDSSPIIGTDGSLLGITRMVHITEYDCFHEQQYYDPGNLGAKVYNTPYGRLGIAICYDRHYPEYMRALALNGAEVVLVPQAGATGEWPEGLYEAEMQVAAFQNGYFVALCNRVGREQRLTFSGESFVSDPRGRVIARAAEGHDEILYCDADLSEIQQSPAQKLFLKDRRPELYSEWISK